MTRQWLQSGKVVGAYIRAVLDLSNGVLVELADVGVEGVDVELLLDSRSVAAVQATLVDIVDPGDVRLEVGGLNALLEGDDVLVGDDLALGKSSGGGGESTREQSSEEESKTAEVGHCKKLAKKLELFLRRLLRGCSEADCP